MIVGVTGRKQETFALKIPWILTDVCGDSSIFLILYLMTKTMSTLKLSLSADVHCLFFALHFTIKPSDLDFRCIHPRYEMNYTLYCTYCCRQGTHFGVENAFGNNHSFPWLLWEYIASCSQLQSRATWNSTAKKSCWQSQQLLHLLVSMFQAPFAYLRVDLQTPSYSIIEPLSSGFEFYCSELLPVQNMLFGQHPTLDFV